MERETIEKARAGDMGAFEAIYREHAGMVFGVALRIVGRVEDAEEVVQDVFVSVHRSLGHFQGKSSFKTWVYRIAVNMSLNILRRGRLARQSELRMPEGAEFEDGRNTFEDRLAVEEREVRVSELLELLSPDQRACMALRVSAGLSYEEIAQTLNVNINTVRTRLRRAREVLLKARAQRR